MFCNVIQLAGKLALGYFCARLWCSAVMPTIASESLGEGQSWVAHGVSHHCVVPGEVMASTVLGQGEITLVVQCEVIKLHLGTCPVKFVLKYLSHKMYFFCLVSVFIMEGTTVYMMCSHPFFYLKVPHILLLLFPLLRKLNVGITFTSVP